MELYSKHMNEGKLISQFMIFLERNVEIELLSALNDIFFPFIKRQHSQYFVLFPLAPGLITLTFQLEYSTKPII